MPTPTRGVIRFAEAEAALTPAPIDPGWVVAGAPEARARPLTFPPESTIDASFWACSAGRFDWHYDRDEVIQIIRGGAELTSGETTISVGPGDIVYFSGGQVVSWHVPEEVAKVAIRSRRTTGSRRWLKRLPLARQVVRLIRARRAANAVRDSRT